MTYFLVKDFLKGRIIDYVYVCVKHFLFADSTTFSIFILPTLFILEHMTLGFLAS